MRVHRMPLRRVQKIMVRELISVMRQAQVMGLALFHRVIMLTTYKMVSALRIFARRMRWRPVQKITAAEIKLVMPAERDTELAR